MNAEHVAPEYQKSAFHCPHCDVLAHHKYLYFKEYGEYHSFNPDKDLWGPPIYGDTLYQYSFSLCDNCDKAIIWKGESPNKKIIKSNTTKMIYPKASLAPFPHQDMPESVKELYEEARNIAGMSPRAAAALLRVSLERLTEELGQTKGNLNTRIKNLKEKGLPESVINSLDIVRITANEGGAHAGQIDLTGKDGPEIVSKLFWLVNFIIKKAISEPKNIQEMYQNIPQNKKQGIKNRDKS